MTTNEIDAQRRDSGGRQRIAKLMARVGLCSRRDAEAWILDGRVSVNGAVLTSPATDVGPDDAILVDDTPLAAPEKTRLFLFHKPRGLVTSDHDPEGRPTVADHLRERWPQGPRVVTVGRLDINTEGLLLLTNDGGLARMLELPRTGWVRRYRVRANGETDQGVLDGLRGGIAIDGVDYAGIEATLDRVQGANVWLTMALREGKNREVKRVLEHIGLGVNRLIRLSFGPFQLGDLVEGAVEEVRTRVLRDQLGEALARAAGVDFGDALAPVARSERPRGDKPRGERPAGERRDARRAERPTDDRRDTQRSARSPVERRADGPRPGRDSYAPRPRGGPQRQEPEGPPPVRERPAKGTRKHVSVLRADEAATKGPRKRTEHADVKDRRNRTVAVERRVAARAALEPTRSRGAGSRAASDDAEARPPRRQASPSAEAKRARAARSGGPARSERPARPERETRRASHSDVPRKPSGAKGHGRETSRMSSRDALPSPARGRRRPDDVGADEGSRRLRDAGRKGGKSPHPPSASHPIPLRGRGPLAGSAPLRGATVSREREKEEPVAVTSGTGRARRTRDEGRCEREPNDKRTRRPPSRDHKPDDRWRGPPRAGKPRGKPDERTRRPPRAGKPGDKPRGKPPRPRR